MRKTYIIEVRLYGCTFVVEAICLFYLVGCKVYLKQLGASGNNRLEHRGRWVKDPKEIIIVHHYTLHTYEMFAG